MNLATKQDQFTHLHLHSVYSLLDGAIRIKDLMPYLQKHGMESVAVTDHGNMFATIEFYEEARKHNIKPILGSEFYVAPNSRKEKRVVEKVADGQAYHLILLAKNQEGYQNLIKLSSISYMEGFYRKPRIDYDILAEHSSGLVCLTACLAGEVNRKLYTQQDAEALALAGKLNEIFGQNNFYLEVQDHGIPEQRIVTRGAIQLSKKLNIPLVLTNDSHFLTRDAQKAQDIMLRIQLNKKIDDPLEFSFNEEFYVKTPSEMKKLIPDHPEAYHNTQVINDMINLELEFGHPLLPGFQVPDKHTLASYLEEVVHTNLKEKFQNTVPTRYIQQLEYELKVIKSMGFEGYFLIVADFIDFAKKSDIPVGPGRGSVAGSLVAYCLNITNVDPLRYNLLFERFLNPSRNEMPDIDIDFCRDRREEVINYVIDKYGTDHVAQIITFGKLTAKAVIKDVARVLGYSFAEINTISKNLPDEPGISLEDAIENDPRAKEFFNSGEKEKTLWNIAKQLEGIPRNPGKHAAGVVIAPKPLSSILPLAIESKTKSVITQFEKDDIEKIGLVKMDFLGLKNLTIIANATREINKRHNMNLNIDDIPLDNPKVYTILQQGKTKGIFQIERSGITSLLQQAIPTNFEDIVACIALYRPGPLQSGMAEEYIKRKHGKVRITYPIGGVEDILKSTFGTIIYQEQVMQIAQKIASFSMAEADILRKAMGKKKMDAMNKMEEQFVLGAVKNGYSRLDSEKVFSLISRFGEYGFNRSHSVAYGLITYQTAYLKANYPIEFYKATLDADIDNTMKLISLIHAFRTHDITILPPDIHESDACFTIINEHTIRYGLLGLKGIGSMAVEALIKVREKLGGYKNLFSFVTNLPQQHLNKKLLEALICSGSLDSLGYYRSNLLHSIDDILRFASKIQVDKSVGQNSLFDTAEEAPNLFIQNSQSEWSSDAKLFYEKETLGLYLTDHPVRKYKDVIYQMKLTLLDEIDELPSTSTTIHIMGVIEKISQIRSKRGTGFLLVTLSDETARKEIRLYPRVYEKIKGMVEENKVLIFLCKISYHGNQANQTNTSLIIMDVLPHKKFEGLVKKSLHINLTTSNLDSHVMEQKINTIKKILQQYTGECPVFFHYKDEDDVKQIAKVHSSLYVKYDNQLETELQAVLPYEKNLVWHLEKNVS